MKKIYFACSIRGGRGDADLYKKLVEIIRPRAIVLSEIFTDKRLTAMGTPGKSSVIYMKDLEWVKEADAVIAEVTNPSLGVGYEIAKAEELGKPVLALYRPQAGRKLSAMVEGNPHVEVFEYVRPSDAEPVITAFIAQL